MSTGDRITILVAAAAVSATFGVGSCSTNARIDDVSIRFDDVNGRLDRVNARLDRVEQRLDDMDRRLDGLQADIGELRALVVDAIRGDAPAG